MAAGTVSVPFWRAAWRWLRVLGGDLKVTDNPYTIRDIRSRVRGIRLPLLLLVYQAVVAGVGLIAIAIYAAASGGIQTPPGRFVFPSLVYTQLVLAPLVAGALTATSVSSEREKLTIDLVIMTPLKGLEVALGKILVPWGLTMLVGLTSLPYAILCMAGGGMAVGPVVLFYLGMALFTAVMSALGLLFSTVSRSSSGAVILTIMVYAAVALVAGVVGLQTYLMSRTTGAPGGAIHGAYTFMLPVTWGAAILEDVTPNCIVFGWEPPFWLPSALMMCCVTLYMLFVAACRLGISPLRHLIVRRVLGMAAWAGAVAVFLAGTARGLFGSTGTFRLEGYTGGLLDTLAIVGGLAAVVGMAVAAIASLTDDPGQSITPLSRIVGRMFQPWRLLSPRPEAGFWLGVYAWGAPVAILLAGHFLLEGTALPVGLPQWTLAAFCAPQLLCVLYGALAGLLACGRHPWYPGPKRTLAAVLTLPLPLWPLLVMLLTLLLDGLRGVPGGFILVAGTYVAALSPCSSSIMLAQSGMTDKTATALWLGTGLQTHPHMLAELMSVLCVVWIATLVVRQWSRNLRAYQAYTAEMRQAALAQQEHL